MSAAPREWVAATEPDPCRYSATHLMRGVPATGTLDCGPVGHVRACDACITFYLRMSAPTPDPAA